MIDRDKVIKGLEKLRKDLGYGLPDRSNVMMEYLNSLTDAITLLKEQEAKPVKIVKNAYNYTFYCCPNCNRPFYGFYNKYVYCDMCGQAVKFE